MNVANRVGVLAIDGQTVTYDKALDIPAGFNPYNVDITPDGKYAVVSATGAGGVNGDGLTVIDTAGPHPHVAALTTVGSGPEGFAISPDGKWAVAPLLLGSGGKYADWSYTKAGEAVLLSVAAGGKLSCGQSAAAWRAAGGRGVQPPWRLRLRRQLHRQDSPGVQHQKW